MSMDKQLETGWDPTTEVLVVDDAPDAAEAIAMALRADGYSVRLAYSGQRALDAVREHLPHCVLLDFDLPDMDGLEVTERLRAEHGDDVVIVAITGWSEERPRVAETFARVDHHFIKPVRLEQLRRILPPLTDAAAKGGAA